MSAGTSQSKGMQFRAYQHLERFGTDEVQNIELGECYVFPKLDGTNASVWLSDGLQAGSRKRHLSREQDNAGFYAWALEQPNLLAYLTENPSHRLFGEWLVPHSLQTYRKDAWRQFYVFDVAVDREKTHEGDDGLEYLHYEVYAPKLAAFGITHVPPLCKLTNGSYEHFVNQLHNTTYLIEDGKGHGEGLVIKRYDFRNRYGRTVWAKIVTNEFKEQHRRPMGVGDLRGPALIEESIAEQYASAALVEKEYAKIVNEAGWSAKSIPRLLETVFYSVVSEECWNFVKKHKNPVVDFGRLRHFCIAAVKRHKPELF